MRKDTQVGLEFQGLTGVAAISLIGGSITAAPVPLDDDGVPVLIAADPDALKDVQEKIRTALRNVDRVIEENQEAVKDSLRNFETFTATLAGNGERIGAMIGRADDLMAAIDDGLAQDRHFPGQPRQRQEWRRIASDRDIAARTDRELPQALHQLHGRWTPHAAAISASP